MNDNTFTCKFCHTILTNPELYTSRRHTETGYDFYCQGCKENYYVDHTTRRIWFYQLWTPKYTANFMRDGTFTVYSSKNNEKLLEIDQYPNITPKNIDQKLSLLLTFS
jgi:hypothetical protein